MKLTDMAIYPEPTISKALFASRLSVPFWTIIRIYLGFLWLRAGWGKINNPAWVGPDAGGPVRGFLTGAMQPSESAHSNIPTWYAWLIDNVFLPNANTMSHLVAYGEVMVGLALIVGFLVGVSAFTGGLLNVSFLLAGTVSTNPVMFILATWLVLAWRVAGYWGIDYWALPSLGAPHGNWREGKMTFGEKEKSN